MRRRGALDVIDTADAREGRRQLAGVGCGGTHTHTAQHTHTCDHQLRATMIFFSFFFGLPGAGGLGDRSVRHQEVAVPCPVYSARSSETLVVTGVHAHQIPWSGSLALTEASE